MRTALFGVTVATVVLLTVSCASNEYKRQLEEERTLSQTLLTENRQLRSQLTAERQRVTDLAERLQQTQLELERLKQATRKPNLAAAFRGSGFELAEREGQPVVVLPSAIMFAPGSAQLGKKGCHVLDRLATVLRQKFPQGIIRIEGHTDSQPISRSRKKYRSNMELSLARGVAVYHYLVEKHKLDKNRLYVAGFGASRPVASNRHPAGREKNRRVEIVILPSP
jgi:chemotaxis protein MotB